MEAIKLWVTRTLVSTLLRNVYMFFAFNSSSHIIQMYYTLSQQLSKQKQKQKQKQQQNEEDSGELTL